MAGVEPAVVAGGEDSGRRNRSRTNFPHLCIIDPVPGSLPSVPAHRPRAALPHLGIALGARAAQPAAERRQAGIEPAVAADAQCRRSVLRKLVITSTQLHSAMPTSPSLVGGPPDTRVGCEVAPTKPTLGAAVQGSPLPLADPGVLGRNRTWRDRIPWCNCVDLLSRSGPTRLSSPPRGRGGLDARPGRPLRSSEPSSAHHHGCGVGAVREVERGGQDPIRALPIRALHGAELPSRQPEPLRRRRHGASGVCVPSPTRAALSPKGPPSQSCSRWPGGDAGTAGLSIGPGLALAAHGRGLPAFHHWVEIVA